MTRKCSVSRSLKSPLGWVFMFLVACGFRGGAGAYHHMMSGFDEMFKQLGDTISNFGMKIPDVLNGAFNEAQKVAIKQEGKCSFFLEWQKGVKCSEFRAFADPQNRLVSLLYRHTEVKKDGDSSSSSTEFIEQSLPLDDDCVVNESVVKMQLAGFMKNDPGDCSKRGHRVRIMFPSKERALKLEKSGELPEGTVKALEAGDTDVVSKLTDDQACSLIREGHDCANLKRGAKLVHAAEEKSGAASSAKGGEKEPPSGEAEEEVPEEQRNRIPLPNIGNLDNEL